MTDSKMQVDQMTSLHQLIKEIRESGDDRDEYIALLANKISVLLEIIERQDRALDEIVNWGALKKHPATVAVQAREDVERIVRGE